MFNHIYTMKIKSGLIKEVAADLSSFLVLTFTYVSVAITFMCKITLQMGQIGLINRACVKQHALEEDLSPFQLLAIFFLHFTHLANLQMHIFPKWANYG